MSEPKPTAGAGDEERRGPAVAKTAGIVAFSGIAMSILKAFFHKDGAMENPPPPISSTADTALRPASSPSAEVDQELAMGLPETQCSARTVEIVKGDTLWGLSREYGVSIEAIKEANGLTGDTIYAGKKLVIP